jgi:epoxyqueuosine reductase
LVAELSLSPKEFNQKFKKSPIKRCKREGYLRNVVVALGNSGAPAALEALESAADKNGPLIREHALWAIKKIINHTNTQV